ncbi:MAG TPA: hypothetical protein VLK82_27815 [Candidatus Tectomicrobia bacterium]|nr:hypothetical protein [Candidatus Tectomicrobia bacterium]
MARSVLLLADCPFQLTRLAALTISWAVSLKPLQAVGLIMSLGDLYAILALPGPPGPWQPMP